MYRLLEENRIIERRLENILGSPSTNSKRLAKAKAALTLNESPPRLPYDELQQLSNPNIKLASPRGKQLQDPPLQYQYNSSSMDTSSHSSGSGSAKERRRSRLEQDNGLNSSFGSTGSAGSTNSGTSRPPSSADRGRIRKPRPWQTDVKINRFSNGSSTISIGRPPLAGTSRTQQSTLGWKQRMQERKAVFGNVAVPERSFDDEESCHVEDDDNDGDGESRSEKNPEQIREEAVELLKSKGFHGILDHHYDDDLESIGGAAGNTVSRSIPFNSPPASDKQQHSIRLGEIQILRQKILEEQTYRDSLWNVNSRDEEESIIDPPLPCSGSIQSLKSTTPAPQDDEDTVKAWKVMKQLQVRLQSVFTEDHVILEAMGRRGVGSPKEDKVVIDVNAFARHKLRDAVERRVSQVFTGDHIIVCNGQIQIGDGGQDNNSVILQESLPGAEGTYLGPDNESQNSQCSKDDEKKTCEKRESFKSPELRERLSDSFLKFEAMLRARREVSLKGKDDYTECTLPVDESSIRKQADMLPSMTDNTHVEDNDDDQSCYSEYTIDTSAFKTGFRQIIVGNPTVVTGDIYTNNMLDDSRKTIKVDNSKAACLANQLGRYSTPKSIEDDDNSFTEYTVYTSPEQQTTPPPVLMPFRTPGQGQIPLQRQRKNLDDQSYMEFTVGDGESHAVKQSDDQSYMELTIREAGPDDSPPTRLPPNRQASAGDKGYMEVTISDLPTNPGVSMPSNDLTSPHLTSMLSSRMFADMQLPVEVKHQQPAQRGFDEDMENYPTITVNPDDDDMTQITFDHTMDEMTTETQEHHHAADYPENGSKSNEVFRSSFTDVNTVVGSLHTEQTRDTTVSDDGSSHQEGASFKSCVSSESNQYVAEILRRDIWSPDAGVVQSALEKLAQQATKGFHERSNIVRYGGLLAMLRAMEMKPDRAEIQIAAYAALEKMSIDTSTQVAIADVGGITAIANSMKSHLDDVNVQQAACRALSNLTKHREGGSVLSSQNSVGTEGVIEIVAKTMTKHPEDVDIQARAFGTLANLCLDNRGRLRELKKSGGLAAMTMALQVDWDNQTDHHEAISTLSVLLRSMTLLDKK